MLFSRTSTGIEISQWGVACALMTGSSAAPRLERVASARFPAETLRISLREHNILDPDGFVDALRAAHNLLLNRPGRVSVSLPDSVGRIMLLDLEGRFKNRGEALDLIRWKLKKNIPFDPADTHLDYQQMTVRENGDLALLVALVSRTVITQYEELLIKAGLTPARIDFNAFNICRTFEQRLSLSEDSIFISFYNGTLMIMAFAQGVPEFVRIKDLSGDTPDSRLFMEINSSLLVYKGRFPEHHPHTVLCVAAPDTAPNFLEMVAEATGMVPTLLETKAAVAPGNAAPGDQDSIFPYTAAIGAALRSF